MDFGLPGHTKHTQTAIVIMSTGGGVGQHIRISTEICSMGGNLSAINTQNETSWYGNFHSFKIYFKFSV